MEYKGRDQDVYLCVTTTGDKEGCEEASATF